MRLEDSLQKIKVIDFGSQFTQLIARKIIDIELKRSNFSKVEELKKDFKVICSIMCKKLTSINSRLKEFENKDAS